MLGRTSPDLSELAYHIVSLCAFRKRSHAQQGETIRAIKPMIEIYFGVDDADSITRTVVTALEAIENVSPLDQAQAEECKVEFVSTLLQKQNTDLAVPRTAKYWATLFSSTTCADSMRA